MTTYYVRKDGNDTTGNGSTETPWLTVVKAIATMSITASHTLKIGPGVYQENYSSGGYIYLNRYANSGFLWTFEAEDPNDRPVLQPTAAGNPVNLMRFTTNTARLTFRNLIFDWDAVATVNTLISISAGTTVADITFEGCEFIWGDTAVYAIGATMTGATKSLARVTVEDCVFTFEGADADGSANAMCFYLSTGISVSDITVRNCRCSMPGLPLWLNGVSNFLVEGCAFHSVVKMSLMVGTDGAATYGANSGTIRGCALSAAASHTLLVGWLSDGVTVQGNQVQGGNQGIVVKEATNVTVTGNTIMGSGVSDYCLLFKAATNSSATYNTIRSAVANGGIVGVANNGAGRLCQNVTLTHNKLIGSGSAGLLYWGGDTHDAGGGVCDYNQYKAGGSGLFGLVRADSSVATLTELRAAWAGYGAGDNDSHSRLKSSAAFRLLF